MDTPPGIAARHRVVAKNVPLDGAGRAWSSVETSMHACGCRDVWCVTSARA